MATAPSGRVIHSIQAFVAPSLDADMIERMRAPLDVERGSGLSHDDDTSVDEPNEKKDDIPGTFPDGSVTGSSNGGSYY